MLTWIFVLGLSGANALASMPSIPSTPDWLSAIESQKALGAAIDARLTALSEAYQADLQLSNRPHFTPELDRWIQAKGMIRIGGALPPPEQAIWGYMSMPPTVLTSPLNPFKRGTYGKGYDTAEAVYRFDPSDARVFRQGRVLGAYPLARAYIETRTEGIAADKELQAKILKLGATAAVVLAKYAVSGGVLPALDGVAALSNEIAHDYGKDFADELLKQHLAATQEESRELAQTIERLWLNPSPRADEEMAGAAEELSAALGGAQGTTQTKQALFSLYRGTVNKLKAIAETAAQPGDPAELTARGPAVAIASREARLGALDLITYFAESSAALSRKCAGILASDVARVRVISRAVIKDDDLAFAYLMKDKAECLAGAYVLEMTEFRWLSNLKLAL